MNICFVSLTFPFDRVDGAGRVFREYYERFQKLGHKVTVLTGLWKKDLNDPNIIQFKIPKKKLFGLLYFILKTRKYLKTHNFDMIHSNMPKSALPVILAGKKNHICTIHDLRCFEDKGSFLEKFLVKFVTKRLKLVLTDSNVVKKQFNEYLPEVDQDKIRVLYVGINERFGPQYNDRKKYREGLGIDGKLLLYVGRITLYKGVDKILEAYNILKTEIKDLNLMIIGEPDFNMEYLYGLWKKIYPDVQFLGFVDEKDLPSYYSLADVFVTCSNKGEGFGLTPLEALACGTPVICSDLPIFREILGTSWNIPLYTAPNSEKGLEFMLYNFFSDPIKKEYILSESKELLKKYEWKQIIFELFVIYTNFVAILKRKENK